jgi:hypothetical protein
MLLGLGQLLPWNTFITAESFFHYCVCGTPFEDNFESYFGLLSVVCCLLYGLRCLLAAVCCLFSILCPLFYDLHPVLFVHNSLLSALCCWVYALC